MEMIITVSKNIKNKANTRTFGATKQKFEHTHSDTTKPTSLFHIKLKTKKKTQTL